ncbi:MAG: hypothetical protein ABWX96_17640 [Propionibacteriaceae bacterium]
MSNQVDRYDAPEPADRFHPQYDGFTEWLDAEAPPDKTIKQRNQPRYRTNSTVTLDALVRDR